MAEDKKIYLASGSPRRQQLLAQIGVDFDVLGVTVDETPLPDELPEDYVIRMAQSKAQTGWLAPARYAMSPVLGADTAVVVDDTILGKPCDREQGLTMLQTLSGREHRVLSAVAIVFNEQAAVRLQTSWVRFRVLTAIERRAYWATGESNDKAGAYAIQGRAAAFIEHLVGSYSGVMGLPLFETSELLQQFGIHTLYTLSES